MKGNTRLFLLVGALVVVGLVVAAVNLTPDGASSQAAPADVLETVSGSRLEATHAIVLVAASPTDKATVQADSLATRLDVEGFATTLLESPKLVRLKGGAVPGAKGSEGLMWALAVDQPPGLTGTVNRPYKPSPGSTGTYLVVFLSAETGDFVMALGGEKFGK